VKRSLFAAALPALVLGALTSAFPAQAQGNYRLAPVGGRTTLVGGTGIVYGQDSASAFLNPATVVRIDKNRLSFSVNFYNLTVVQAPSWYRPGPVDTAQFGEVPSASPAVTAVDFDTLPGSLCVFLRVADIGFLAGNKAQDLREKQARLGLCLASVQQHSFTFSSEDFAFSTPLGESRQTQTIRQTFRRLAVGPTYSMYVSNSLAIGASIHFSRSSVRSIFGATATTYGGPRPINSVFYGNSHGDSHDLSATLGLTYRIGAHQTLGFALELPSVHLFGGGGISRYTHGDGASPATSSVAAEGSFASRTPFRIGMGTGIERPWGNAEMNVGIHLPVGGAYTADLKGRTLDVDSNGTVVDLPRSFSLSSDAIGSVNIGVGGEVYFNPRLSLLGGLSTDTSVVRKGDLQRDIFRYFPTRTHRATLSIGIGSHGEGGDLLFGTELSYGWGERLNVNSYQVPPELELTSQKTYGLLLVLAGSTSFRSIRRAVEDVTKAIDPTSKPEPKDKPAPAKPALEKDEPAGTDASEPPKDPKTFPNQPRK